MVPKKLKIRVYWSEREQDFMIATPRKSDGHFMHSAFLSKRLETMFKSTWDAQIHSSPKEGYSLSYPDPSNPKIVFVNFDWIRALGNRGFDLKTLKFEITINKDQLATEFSHMWQELTDREKEEAIRLGFTPPV